MEEIKHGTWEHVSKQHGNAKDGFWTERLLKCSVCGYERRHSWIKGEQPNYCEDCGAYLKGEEDGQ